ncbi:putative MATE family efflux protein [Lachnospiraceae bacterium PF1-4]
MRIQLSDHFNYRRLFRFVWPSIMMMIFTSIYGVVDGIFVSNYVGKTAFAAVNIIYPVTMILSAVGFMIGTGGSAIVSQALGEKSEERARQYFSMLIYVAIGVGIVLAVLGVAFLRPIAILLGAEGEMIEQCVTYGRILLVVLPFAMLQYAFQSFLVTAERPNLGLVVTIGAGLTNIVFDFLFVAVFSMGLVGAAVATAMSQVIGGVIPLVFFARKNSSTLHLTKAKLDTKVLLKTCSNGASELVTNMSTNIVNILFNIQLMRMIGEDGVVAYGVIMYANFIFIAIFFGYAIGSAPIISYHYGAKNTGELKNLLRKSLVMVAGFAIIMLLMSQILAPFVAKIFVSYDAELLELTTHAFRIYAISFLFMGFGIFGSAFFTALGNGEYQQRYLF